MTTPRTPPALCLRAATAADLMSSNPVSLRAEATVADAVALLTARGYSGAPVIGESGRPLGVLTQTDLLIHACGSGASPARTRVRDVMTPVVFTVTPDTPAEQVVQQMLALKVHRLFGLDAAGVLVGVISAIGVLRHLGP